MDLALLNEKVALVTDGAYGLGRAVSMALAAEGAGVVVDYHRRPEQAEALAEEVRQRFSCESMAVEADISAESEVVAMFDRAEQRFGGVDILVNNAAVCPTRWVKDMSSAEWNDMTGATVDCSGGMLMR